MDIGLLVLQLIGVIIWLGVLAPALILVIAGLLEAAYSLNWGAWEIWGKGGGETLALLW